MSTTVPRMHFGNPANIYLPKKPELIVGKPAKELQGSVSLQHETEQLLIAEYAPPGVVINDDMEIILATGNTAPYIKLPQGLLSLNLFKMVRQEIAPDLRMMIQSAKKLKKRVKRDNLNIHNGQRQNVFLNITVIPFRMEPKNRENFFLVLFEPTAELLLIEPAESTDRKTKEPAKRTLILKSS
jgi:two-component system CheB/CheR fusion protein